MARHAPTIRALGESVWDAWWALRLVALRDHPDAFGSSYEETRTAGEAAAHQRFISTASDRIFGAFAPDHSLIGVCGIRQHTSRKERHRMGIWGMYVTPDWRGTGTADRLISAALQHARHVGGVVQVHLAVASHNDAAYALYTRHGFVQYGLEPRSLKLPGRFVDEACMVMMLDTSPGE